VSLFDDPGVVGGKVCSTCRLWKPLDSFNRRSAAPDGRQWSCRSCNAAYHRRHKKRINAMVQARNKRVWADNVERLLAHLLAHPCVDCGERDPLVLEFDHQRDKIKNIAQLVRGWSWQTIEREIAKCDVVCANCHRRRTFTRQGSWRVRLSATLSGGGGGARTHKPAT
jgi:hypothetical protein